MRQVRVGVAGSFNIRLIDRRVRGPTYRGSGCGSDTRPSAHHWKGRR